MARPMLYNHLSTLLSVLTSTSFIYILLSHRPLRDALYTLFHPKLHPIHFAVLLAIFFINIKALPFMWHVRLFRNINYQFYLQPTVLPTKGALFKPMITKGLHSPLLECDYNGHKSNSTYFADADQARTAHVIALFRKGLTEAAAYDRKRAAALAAKSSSIPIPTPLIFPAAAAASAASTAASLNTAPVTSTPTTAAAPSTTTTDSSSVAGVYIPVLGGVSCHFRREIKPHERYDIWTRVLSWDRKWIYLVSHFVKEGTVQPTEWALQPWKTVGRSKSRGKGRERKDSGVSTPGVVGEAEKTGQLHAEGVDERWKKAVFATSIARYVIKKGRLTIAPDECFERSDLLPARSEGKEGYVDSKNDDENAWTWENVEAKRVEGMRYAEKFAALEELHEQWPVLRDAPGSRKGAVEVMGEFADLW